MGVKQASRLMREIKEKQREAIRNKDFYLADQLKHRKKILKAYFRSLKKKTSDKNKIKRTRP